jgi:hypothetical protein
VAPPQGGSADMARQNLLEFFQDYFLSHALYRKAPLRCSREGRSCHASEKRA